MIRDHYGHDDEFLAAAVQNLGVRTGPAALDDLGWWDLLVDLADVDSRVAVFAAFRAQGRVLADSAALGGILAQPFIERTAVAPGAALAAIRRRSLRRGTVWTVVGEIDDRVLLFDQPGRGVSLVAPDAVDAHLVDVPGRLTVYEVSADLAVHPVWLDEDAARAARARSAYLGRVAIAAEILGAAERAVDLAIAHATDREQFGRPIGAFQAVRHILAWAKTDCIAVDSVVRKAILMLEAPPARFGEVTKALAGRNGRRACERSLQVLGGIGFTTEHAHHHHHSRVLLLDALLGSSAELSLDLGRWLRTEWIDPQFPAAVLAAEPG